MSLEFTLDAQPREDMGKGASRRLRRAGKVPAIVYGGSEEPEAITLDHNAVIRSTEAEAFFSHILKINLGNTTESVILKDLQRHPAKPVILHLDFQRVSEDQEIQVHVPLHFVGEDVAPGIKQEGGTVSHLMTDVEVRCLPASLPEFLNVDLSNLHVNEVVKLSDLSLPEGVSIPTLSHGPEYDNPVASIHPARGAGEGAAEEEQGPGEEQ